jgi:hypothetical protein
MWLHCLTMKLKKIMKSHSRKEVCTITSVCE